MLAIELGGGEWGWCRKIKGCRLRLHGKGWPGSNFETFRPLLQLREHVELDVFGEGGCRERADRGFRTFRRVLEQVQFPPKCFTASYESLKKYDILLKRVHIGRIITRLFYWQFSRPFQPKYEGNAYRNIWYFSLLQGGGEQVNAWIVGISWWSPDFHRICTFILPLLIHGFLIIIKDQIYFC